MNKDKNDDLKKLAEELTISDRDFVNPQDGMALIDEDIYGDDIVDEDSGLIENLEMGTGEIEFRNEETNNEDDAGIDNWGN